MTMEPPSEISASRGLVAAVWATFVGGMILAFSWIGIPLLLVALGTVLFLFGTVAAGTLAWVAARRSRKTVLQSLWDGTKAAVAWIVVWFP